ncbi:MAG: hypothetical protein ACJ71T_01290 [Actinomycetales bacterium]
MEANGVAGEFDGRDRDGDDEASEEEFEATELEDAGGSAGNEDEAVAADSDAESGHGVNMPDARPGYGVNQPD